MMANWGALLRANLRWQVIALIFVGTILNYLARNSLGVLAPVLKDQLHITTAQYSYVVGAFQLAYTVMLPICGLVLDRAGLRLGFAVFAAIWSFANMAHAMALGWLSLAVLRGVLGMAEAAVIPAGVKASTEWFPPRERAAAIGWVNVGTALGAVLAVPIVSTLALWFDWRAAFLCTGLAGLVYAVAWYAIYRRPDEHPRLTAAERAHIESEGTTPPAARPGWPEIRAMLADPAFRTIAIPRFLAEPAWQTFNFWIPLYLAKERGMDLKHIAMFAWLPFLMADIGGLTGGYISPWIARITRRPLITARVIGASMAALLMIGPGCIGLVASPYAALALLCLGGFAHQTLSVLINTFTADCYPSARVGTANGFVSQAGWLGGLLFSLAIGQLADRIGFAPLFGALGVFDLIGAMVLWLGLTHLLRAARVVAA